MSGIAALLVLCIVGALVVNEIYQQKNGVAPMPTMLRTQREMVAALPPDISGVIYDLGSGWGSLAFSCAARCPQATVIGFETSPLPLLISWIRKSVFHRTKNVSFRAENFFEQSLKDARAIVCYLSNAHMAKLASKFKQELIPGTWIISAAFAIPGWDAAEIKTVEIGKLYKTQVYIYRA